MSDAPPRRALQRDPSFRAADQAQIALFVAQLDDQTRRLGGVLGDLTAEDLAWQPRPGRNSAGMLFAHIAITEVFWMGVATGRAADRSVTDDHCREILGVGLDDDGMPAPADGGHPAALAGWDLARHADLLRRAREYLKAGARSWRDADLAESVAYGGREFTREWILYHLLEHYAQHAGQVGLVLALRRSDRI